VLDLGKISISNHFFISEQEHELSGNYPVGEAPVVSRVPMEAITVTVSALNLMRTTMDQSIQADCDKMLEDATVSMRVQQPLADVKAKGLPSLDLESDVLTIHVSLSQEECGFLLTAWAMDLEPLLATLDGPSKESGDGDDLVLEPDVEEEIPEMEEPLISPFSLVEVQPFTTPSQVCCASLSSSALHCCACAVCLLQDAAMAEEAKDGEDNSSDALIIPPLLLPVPAADKMIVSSITFRIREIVLDLNSSATGALDSHKSHNL
jgi:hypothetical protein